MRKMKVALERIAAVILLPIAVFFWSANWAVLSQIPDHVTTRIHTKVREIRAKAAYEELLSDNPVIGLIRAADPNDVGMIDPIDPRVQITLALVKSMYNQSFNHDSPAGFQPDTRIFLVVNRSAERLSMMCGCYGESSENIAVILVRPDDNPMMILAHESVHLLQYSQYGNALYRMDRLMTEYQAEFISVRVTQLMEKAFGANEIRIVDARMPNILFGLISAGGNKMDKAIAAVMVVLMAVVVYMCVRKKKDVLGVAKKAEDKAKDEMKKVEAKAEEKKAEVMAKVEEKKDK